MAGVDLTAQRLRELLDYDPLTGRFTNLVRRSQAVRSGTEPGTINKTGHRRMTIDGRLYLAHRLAWFWVHGEWPTQKIDHINGMPDDNRIANLRDVSPAINSENRRRATVRSKLGVLGVRIRFGTKFNAQINVKGKTKNLGDYDTLAEAQAVYIAAKRKYHKGCTL